MAGCILLGWCREVHLEDIAVHSFVVVIFLQVFLTPTLASPLRLTAHEMGNEEGNPAFHNCLGVWTSLQFPERFPPSLRTRALNSSKARRVWEMLS